MNEMYITHNSNGRYYLLTVSGCILHSENTIKSMIEWCKNNFAGSYAAGLITIKEA